MVRFASQNGASLHPFAANWGSESRHVNGSLMVFDMGNIVSEMSVFCLLHPKTPPLALHKYAKHCIFMQKQPQIGLIFETLNVKFQAYI